MPIESIPMTTARFIQQDVPQQHPGVARVEDAVSTVQGLKASLLGWDGARGAATLLLVIVVDEKLRKDIESAQEKWDLLNNELNILEIDAEYNNSPYYNTFAKIGLNPKESQALCQMWAWAVSENSNLVNQAIKNFIYTK